MNTHPLFLYETVLAIGQFIPLWESNTDFDDDDLWLFKPKDLLAAISVNRLFRATLTPLLWSVYVESAVKSLACPKFVRCCLYRHYISIDIVEKNSSYIRFLDLSSFLPRSDRKVELLDFNCSRLQELHLNASVSCAWAKRLILANPDLRVLHWTREKISREDFGDFESVLSLRRLRYLALHDWSLYIPQLYSVLANNAEHLEELRLIRCNSTVPKRLKQDEKGKVHITYMNPRDSRVEELQPMKRMCWRIRLAKLKTLHLDVETCVFPLTLYWLVNVAPALETVVFGALKHNTSKALSRILRRSCPRLRSIKQGRIWMWEGNIIPPKFRDYTLHLVSACAPGHLAHASLDVWRIDNTFVEAISVHLDSLETLELALFCNAYGKDSFNNLGTILERCGRLKHLAVHFHGQMKMYGRHPSLFLEKLATCPGLESLAFRRFILSDKDNHLHESSDDPGRDEGTSTVRITRNQELGDYEPEPYIFDRPEWRELFLGFDLDHREGVCCNRFKRLCLCIEEPEMLEFDRSGDKGNGDHEESDNTFTATGPATPF
ncbi:hypothetical protein K457DRAFT_23821 [Linnemannia elongata AG-77]|uniref:F-box domain-containing protein n=1 Tax=Linnemannia elongata AG-77 TaxID=1314771 RepID=A0A197JHR9_9FUNG|nr:hypothetical protein K457DRAFT_23821 [Linnemannia elongata AG-77]